MNHGSLFSGIGGFDLAAEWMGWTNVFHCEWEEFPRKVLNYHFPKSITYGDITKTDFTIHRGQIDILTGGFPCQPYSSAGKRLGKEDERHLWPHMLRAIREIQPRWVVGENVRGLVNWNGGLVFEEVQTDLEAEGYEVQAFILPAAGVNAPHRRDRVWFVAYANDKRRGSKLGDIPKANGEVSERNENSQSSNTGHSNATDTNSWRTQTRSFGKVLGESDCERKTSGSINESISGNATDTDSKLPQHRYNSRATKGSNVKKNTTKRPHEPRGWQEFPTQSPICGGNDGIPRELDSITFSKWRKESIKAYGNAIVPQVVYPIFKSIASYESKRVQ